MSPREQSPLTTIYVWVWVAGWPRWLMMAPILQVWYQRCSGHGGLGQGHCSGLRRGRRQHRCKFPKFQPCPRHLATGCSSACFTGKGQVFHVRAFSRGQVFHCPSGPTLLRCSRVAVPEFNPAEASGTKANAALLQAAEAHLGNSLSALYVAMPTLASCGFKASFAKRPVEMLAERVESRVRQGARGPGDAASTAVAAVGPSMGVDTSALRALVESARKALAEASR